MTDIQQWRRKIQPARAKTPAVDTDDSDGFLSPTTPKKGLRPKLSSYFAPHTTPPRSDRFDVAFSGNDIFATDPFAWPMQDTAPNPDPERLIDSVMSRLLANPYKALDRQFNCTLLEIFESFRNLSNERDTLASNLQRETERRSTLERTMHASAQQWERDKGEYKAEVKRLELLLAKGERGLAEVTLARQDSMLRRGQRHRGNPRDDTTLETIFEFLERTSRYEDKVWGSQRATMKRRPSSPSVAMRRLSQTLKKKSSMSYVHGELPFGTPFDVSVLEQTRRTGDTLSADRPGTGLSQYPPLEGGLNHSFGLSELGTSLGSLSTFSCAGDPLPDETAAAVLVKPPDTDSDFTAMHRIAQALAKRRGVDPKSIMPKLHELFAGDVVTSSACNSRSSSVPNVLDTQLIEPTAIIEERVSVENNLKKHPRLKHMASEFVSRWRPQLHVDTSLSLKRRFSFEPGDDTEASLSAPPLDNLPAAVKDRLLRKSVSLSVLSEGTPSKGTQQDRTLSPVQQSPTTSAPISESRRPSRIPTPVYGNGSLARPRQEREDSASSLLTAINLADHAYQLNDSMSSPGPSPPYDSRADLTHEAQGMESNGKRNSSSNPLLEHTNALRGSAFATAAAKTAVTNITNVDQGNSTTPTHEKRLKLHGSGNGSRSSARSRSGEHGNENTRPMAP